MSENIFISVIVPTYNRAHLIKSTIDSLLNQTYTEYEIIVVDDGSTDGTEAVIKQINSNRIRYYKTKNSERGAARNFGADLAKGTYLNFFDSDDLAFKNHLSEAAACIPKLNNPEIFTLGYQVISPDGIQQRCYNNYPGNLSATLFEKGNILSCDAVFIRKDIAIKFPFNEQRQLAGSEDAVLWMQLAARFQWKFSNTVTSAIVDHESRSVLTINKDALTMRLNLFVKNVTEDAEVQNKFTSKLNNIRLEAFTYAALHLVLAGYKKEALSYYLKSLRLRPQFVFTKRSLATLKRLVF